METYSGRSSSAVRGMDEGPRGNKNISPNGQRPLANSRKSDGGEDTLTGEVAAIGNVAQNYLAEANTTCTETGEWYQQTEADLLQSLEHLLNELYGEAQKQAEEDRNKARQEAARITQVAMELRQVAQQEMDKAKRTRTQVDEHLERVRKEAEAIRENAQAELEKAQEYSLEAEKGLEQVRAEARSIKEQAGREATRIRIEARTQAHEIVQHVREVSTQETEEAKQLALQEVDSLTKQVARLKLAAQEEHDRLAAEGLRLGNEAYERLVAAATREAEEIKVEASQEGQRLRNRAERALTKARQEAEALLPDAGSRITPLEQESATRALKGGEEINRRALGETQEMLAEAARVQREAKAEAGALLKTSREEATYLLTQAAESKRMAEEALEQARSARTEAIRYQEDLSGQLGQLRAALRDPNFLMKAREAIKKAHLAAPGDLDEKVNQARSFLDLAHLYSGTVEIEVSPISSTQELVKCQQQFRDLLPEAQITEFRPDEGGKGVVFMVELGTVVPLVKILKDRLVNGTVQGVSNSRVKVTLNGQQPAVSVLPASA